MTDQVRGTEEFFLKIVKNSILVMMAVALLAIPILLVFGGVNFLSKAKEPEPAKAAPVKEVAIDGMAAHLLRLQKDQDDAEKLDVSKKKVTEQDQQDLVYRAEATKIQICALGFAKEAGVSMEARTDKVVEEETKMFTGVFHESMRAPGRGRPNVDSLVGFLCKVFADPGIIQLRKTEKVRLGVTRAAIGYHQAVWDSIVREKQQFEDKEEARVANERGSEIARIGADRARALFSLTAAASAFAAFMLLAIYLILAKMETNMRDIDGSIKTQR